jgi:hypothetical protein
METCFLALSINLCVFGPKNGYLKWLFKITNAKQKHSSPIHLIWCCCCFYINYFNNYNLFNIPHIFSSRNHCPLLFLFVSAEFRRGKKLWWNKWCLMVHGGNFRQQTYSLKISGYWILSLCEHFFSSATLDMPHYNIY